MKDKSKIVDFQTVANQRQELRLTGLLADLRDSGLGPLCDSLAGLLDNADDALFELADRAFTATEQNLYFEAMREIRVRRRDLEEAFRREVTEGFRSLLSSDVAGKIEASKLELLEYDDVEEQVAVEGMANKAEKRFQPQIANFCASIAGYVKAKGLALDTGAKNIPFGSLALCKAFASACSPLEIDIKPKLVLFKLFDRHVMGELAPFYQAVETTLRKAGFWVEVEAGSVQASGATKVSIEVSGDVPGNVFDVLKTLAQKPEAGAGGGVGAGGATAQIYLSKSALIAVLQELQSNQLERLNVEGFHDQVGAEITPLPAELAAKLQGVRQEKLEENDSELAQRDFDVINLVALLFQYILEDENLATPMKGLIGHLQIPVLKAAMLDKSFFSKDGHPARLLLNKIADACIGWSPAGECEDDPLFIKVESIVKDLLGNPDGSVALFQGALEEFEDYLAQERRRAELITKRLLDAEGSRVAADTARAEVDKLLTGKFNAATSVPAPLKTLLKDGWGKVLFLHHVQQGTDSDAWAKAVELVDRLLWSVSPITSSAQREQLLTELPHLLEELRAGLNQVGYSPFDMKQLLHELEEIHLELLKSASQKSTDSQRSQEAVDLESLDASLAQSLGEVVSDEARAKAEEILSRLQVGIWVEFVQGESKKLRCRLAAIIASTGKFIFVNRSGVKVAEYGRDELAGLLARGQVTLMDDSMLFDRALESVISNLRDMKDKPI